ncbi:hypothetical protein [Erwinia sp. S38]|uniref:hypothetical protein n=1 Tax=Erwinia sp. S38 TaxID=2769338 RepID=UPI00190A6F9C|nr:hypothetical protein [Erwinia sp. S38]MBK0004365.1 hypothetical protein [Erwinia sp. S38]
MYTVEELLPLIETALEGRKEYYLDIGAMTADDYKDIEISARKANLIQEIGKKIAIYYPFKEYYTDDDVEQIIAKLIIL